MEKILLEFLVSYYLIISGGLFLIGSIYLYIPDSSYIVATCYLQGCYGYFITGFISMVDIILSKPEKYNVCPNCGYCGSILDKNINNENQLLQKKLTEHKELEE